MKYTKIEWCDHTFNPWIGCTKISNGPKGACNGCYAEVSTPARTMAIQWGPGQPRHRTSAATWAQPLVWDRNAGDFQAEHGRRQRVFCASLADVFDNEVDEQWREDLFRLIEATPNLDWLLLTKRIGNVGNMLPVPFDFDRLYPNVWLGATVVTQEEADRDIPKLLAVPAAKHFLSMEPLLGPVDLERPMPGPDIDQGSGAKICQPWMIQSGIDWVIVGGESGPGARPMRTEWVHGQRDQCVAAKVPFLFKQWGEWLGQLQTGNPAARVLELNATDHPIRIGKKAAGRELDGRTWDEVPHG